ncbi:MAG TPA: phenylacetate-CoA oxygenase subunit PaaI, partial [Bacteroidia bacterium]|nr:phenylacetate-CoA oxygenase subunit PaaI [Bacteroidia bacterium]
MNNLFVYTLRLADNSLVLAQRLSEWTGHGPFLEEDLALTNVALDTFGTATSLLEYAAQVEGKGRSADDLAYFRHEREYTNVLLVEQPNGDYAKT